MGDLTDPGNKLPCGNRYFDIFLAQNGWLYEFYCVLRRLLQIGIDPASLSR